MIRVALTILLFLLLTVFQITVLPQLNIVDFLLLPFPMLLFSVEFWPKPVTYASAITAAFSLSLFATAPLSAYLFAFVLTVVVAEVLYEHFFTNRSFYGTLVLTILATLVFETVLLLVVIFTSDAESISLSRSFTHVWRRIVGNTAAMIVLMYLLLGIERIFRSWFFIREPRRY